MAGKSSLLLLFYFVFILCTQSMITGGRRPTPPVVRTFPPSSGSSVKKSSEFMRSRCRATRYPSLCFSSLAAYSSSVRQSPVQLARDATNLSLDSLATLSARVATLRRARTDPTSARVAAALRDCAEALGDAVDEVRRAAAELRQLDTAAARAREVAWRVSNARTWMSAALTNEDTCADGFGAVRGGRTKAEVVRLVRRVKKYTSNALALLHSLVTTR